MAIAGPNGGGKTTLIRLALGLARPNSGAVRLFGEAAHRFSGRATLGYVAQRAQIGGHGPVTVREVVGAGRLAQEASSAPSEPATARSWTGPSKTSDSPITRRLRSRSSPAASSSAPSSPRPSQASLRCSSWTSRPRESMRSPRRLAGLLDRLHRDRRVTTLYVSHEFGAVEEIVERLVLVRGGIVFDGPPATLPSQWHDPSHGHARE